MERIEKTVFISYRRTNIPWALAIFQNLTQHGYDVFFDYSGIASGDFERVILENITARAHFLVLLTPSALERCDDPADWLRREIETALANQRNIVPLMLEGFDFGAPKISNQLRGELAALKHYNGLRILPDYFDEAMERLRSRYLNVPSNAVLHPTSLSARQAVTQQKAAAEAAPAVQQKELTGSKPEELKADSVRTNPDDSQTYVWIPPGEFLMGCSPSDTECLDNEKPPHTVRITRGFWLGQTPVTVGAYRRFAEKNGVSMPPEPSCNPRWSDSEQPIVRVTWNQARDYCEWAKGRLPTEAEWEYAA
jgi:hypothetical protein